MSGSATLATARFRLATAATRMRARQDQPARPGPIDSSAAGDWQFVQVFVFRSRICPLDVRKPWPRPDAKVPRDWAALLTRLREGGHHHPVRLMINWSEPKA